MNCHEYLDWEVNGIEVIIEYRVYPAEPDLGQSLEIVNFLDVDANIIPDSELGRFSIAELTSEIATEVFAYGR